MSVKGIPPSASAPVVFQFRDQTDSTSDATAYQRVSRLPLSLLCITKLPYVMKPSVFAPLGALSPLSTKPARFVLDVGPGM